MEIKKNITLIIGIAIPILMVAFVAISVYVPGLFVQPKYSFLYVSVNDYSYPTQYQYAVQNGKLVRSETTQAPVKPIYQPPYPINLYVYDITSNTSREISFEEAQKLNLDSGNKSPDGFEVIHGNQSNGFLFFSSGSDYNTVYMTGHNVSKKLNLQLNGGSYYDNFRFLGWIK